MNIQTESYSFEFLGTPKAVQSFRFTRAGFRFQPKDVVDWKNYIRMVAISQLPQGFKPLEGPLAILVLFDFELPKSAKKIAKKRIADGLTVWKTTKPDLTDNLMKGLIDALSGVVWNADQQICQVSSQKRFSRTPKTTLNVTQLEEDF